MMPDRLKEMTRMQRRKNGPAQGTDGAIPSRYVGSLRSAIDIVWRLDTDPGFFCIYQETLLKLTGKQIAEDAFPAALNKMIVNCADSSKDGRIRKELESDKNASKLDPRYQSPPAYSFVNGAHIWIREWQLAKGDRAIASSFLHESTHLVGAPNNPLAEWALDRVHAAAGLPR